MKKACAILFFNLQSIAMQMLWYNTPHCWYDISSTVPFYFRGKQCSIYKRCQIHIVYQNSNIASETRFDKSHKRLITNLHMTNKKFKKWGQTQSTIYAFQMQHLLKKRNVGKVQFRILQYSTKLVLFSHKGDGKSFCVQANTTVEFWLISYIYIKLWSLKDVMMSHKSSQSLSPWGQHRLLSWCCSWVTGRCCCGFEWVFFTLCSVCFNECKRV